MSSICNNGFTTQNKYNTITHFTDKTKGIRFYDNNFVFPDRAIDVIKNLNKLCNTFLNDGENCEFDCTSSLTRWPILKPTTIRYQVISFERE